jgi:hypothetical protein
MGGRLSVIIGSVVGAWFLAVAATAQPGAPSATPPSVEHPGRGWAILRYKPRLAALTSEEVDVVRASSEAFAQVARATVAGRVNESMKRELNKERLEGRAEDSGPAAVLKERAGLPAGATNAELAAALMARSGPAETLFIEPDPASPKPVRAALTTPKFPWRPPDALQKVYYRAKTDGRGNIVSLEVLYADKVYPRASTDRNGGIASPLDFTVSEPEARRIAAFAQENLKFWAPDSPNVPLEVFGTLFVKPEGYMEYEWRF